MDESMNDKPATAGVIAPPPLLLLAALIAGLTLDRLAPLGLMAQIPAMPRYVAGGILIAAGLAMAFVASRRFGRAGTPRAPWLPTTKLVTDGVFAHIRNPMYASFYLALAGVALAVPSDWLVAAMVVLALVIHYGVVKREERYLEALFGDEYRAYKARTPRYGWRL
jgi:protein-S-isoprenylcysteine O-methyltransferase Ste14